MELGVVGKPNVGKSTFFAAATLAPVHIANYPFTTVQANHGVAYVRKKCPHLELGHACKPKNAPCQAGTRLIPVEMLDVAGLVAEPMHLAGASAADCKARVQELLPLVGLAAEHAERYPHEFSGGHRQ